MPAKAWRSASQSHQAFTPLNIHKSQTFDSLRNGRTLGTLKKYIISPTDENGRRRTRTGLQTDIRVSEHSTDTDRSELHGLRNSNSKAQPKGVQEEVAAATIKKTNENNKMNNVPPY